MELQIQDLVSSIRKDGIEAANAEAEAIISEAKKKAETIVADAKAEAKSVQEASEKEIGICLLYTSIWGKCYFLITSFEIH